MEIFEAIGVGVCAIVAYVVITAIIGYMLIGFDMDRLAYLPWMMWGVGGLICTVIVVTVCDGLL